MTEKSLEPGRGKTVGYFVYVLRNRAGILYTGIALDVAARCALHNDGRGARFTRGRGPWAVIHVEGPLAKGDALRRELRIKADRRLKAIFKAARAPKLGPRRETAPPAQSASFPRPPA